MKRIKTLLLGSIISLSSFWTVLPIFADDVSTGTRYSDALEASVKGIEKQVMADTVASKWSYGVLAYIQIIVDILLPVIVTLWVGVAIFWAYTIMTSNKEEKVKDGMNLVIFGVLGIIIMYSANFLADTLMSDILDWAISTSGVNALQISQQIYEKLAMPFIKLAIYLGAGFLFFILAGRVFTFLTSSDEWTRKKAVWVITRTVIGILIIMAAKEVVEAIFGKRGEVFNSNASNLWEIWSSVLSAGTIPIVYQVINWIMWFTVLIVLVLIIFQTIQLLVKPDSADMMTKLKKTILYVGIGIVVIGAGYIISNVLIIN